MHFRLIINKEHIYLGITRKNMLLCGNHVGPIFDLIIFSNHMLLFSK